MNRLLYFPTISVPNNAWLRQSLLYWDGVSSMVPADFWEVPEQHSAEMLELVRTGIVSQEPIMPNTSQMPNFEKNFIQFLSQKQRNATKIRSNWVHVHVEKLGYGKLSEHLQRTGLATFDGGSWMLVEPQTANEFMAYLATCIANQTKQSKFIASTDDPKKLGLLASNKSEMARLTHKAIDAILPSPVEDVDIRDIVEFRDSNKQHLDALRSEVKLRVERSILTNSNNLDELFDLEIADLKNQANKLSTKMKQRNWGLIGFGSFTGLGSAILGAEPLLDGAVTTVDGAVGFGLASAISATISGARQQGPEGYAAYAAIAATKFT